MNGASEGKLPFIHIQASPSSHKSSNSPPLQQAGPFSQVTRLNIACVSHPRPGRSQVYHPIPSHETSTRRLGSTVSSFTFNSLQLTAWLHPQPEPTLVFPSGEVTTPIPADFCKDSLSSTSSRSPSTLTAFLSITTPKASLNLQARCLSDCGDTPTFYDGLTVFSPLWP